MGQLFKVAEDFIAASPEEIEALLERPDHPPRVVGVSIMDFQARQKTTSEDRRRDLYELYLRRHDRIDAWDLVDRAAPHVVGGYLWDKSRRPLYLLAESPRWYERRTSIVSTWFFVRRGDLDDTFCTLGCSVCLGVVLGSATSPGRLNLMLPARDGEALDRWLPPGGGDGRRGRPIEAWGKGSETAAPECLRVAGPAVTSNRR